MMTFIRFISEAVSKHSAYTKSLSNKAFKNDKALNKSVKTIESILEPSEETPIVLFSAQTGEGASEIWKWIWDAASA